MFAALMVARLREAVAVADHHVRTTPSWVSPDSVPATDLPLARATVKVLASMHRVLERTLQARNAELAASAPQNGAGSPEEQQKREHLHRTKAAEVRLVRNVQFLRDPQEQFEVQEWSKEDLPAQLR
jgi:pyridoxine kinase